MTDIKDINPAIGGMLRSARDMLSHEHSLFKSLNLKPLTLGAGESRFALDLSTEFSDGDVIYSGMLTTVLDSIMGMTVFTALEEFKPIATINLKTNYIRDAAIGERIICDAKCHSIRDDVAFVRGAITAEAGNDEIASAIGAFMVGTRGIAKGSRL